MEQVFKVEGMSCAACEARVKKALLRVDGVSSCDVMLMKNECTVVYDEAVTCVDLLVAAVRKSGYALVLKEDRDSPENAYDEAQLRVVFVKLVLSLVLTFMVMLFSMGPMFSLTLIEDGFTVGTVCCVLTVLVMLLQKEYFLSALKALSHGQCNMDTLISLGAFFSFAYSVWTLVSLEEGIKASQVSLFFEGAAGILTFVGIGKYLEKRARNLTTRALTSLYRLAPKTVTVKDESGEHTLMADRVKPHDIVVVRQGERIGVDGIIVKGKAEVDESSLSGESLPRFLECGAKVCASTLVINGYLEIETEVIGKDTTLGRIITLVEKASLAKVPLSRLADRIAAVFVPFVLGLALVTFFCWYFIGDAGCAQSLSFAVSVLVISCPCALGLATPVALVAGNGLAAKAGIIFKEPQSIEFLEQADTFVFDKTGTLTYGTLELIRFETFYDCDRNMALKIAVSLETRSAHPISHAFVGKDSVMEVTDYSYEVGTGIFGTIYGQRYALGNLRLRDSLHLNLSFEVIEKIEAAQREELLPLMLFDLSKKGDEMLVAIFYLGDILREDSFSAILSLKALKKKVLMLSGDSKNSCEWIAKKLAIDDFYGELMPWDKEEYLKKLKAKGHKVVMIGDGINDSISLKAAHVGVGMGGAADIAIDSCDVVLLKSQLTDLYKAFMISRITMRNIKENLFFAFIYNVLAIPVAMGVFYNSLGLYLNPMLCAFLMGMSSLCVVLNASRLSFYRIKPLSIPVSHNDEKESGINNVSKSNEEKLRLMKKVLTIEGMMCNHCKMSVEKALKSVPSAQNVCVSLEDKNAVLEVMNSVPDDVLKQAVSDAGFTVTAITDAKA